MEAVKIDSFTEKTKPRMEGFDGHPGTSRLAAVLSRRIKREKESPLLLDFGEIQANGSLLTNTFPIPIPKGDYSVCRQLTLGKTDEKLTKTKKDGEHPHPGVGEGGSSHEHTVLIPEKMRSLKAGDRVLVAWVQNEAVVVDLIEKS